MANRWTDEQLQAINVEGCNVIVSAGAGSGKTAVLTQRVLRKIKSNIPINKLLILTFTKAAAKEMKDRIRRTLKKEGFNEQLKLLDSAYISTFDSFSLSVVKKYHINLGINKDIKVTDAALINIRKKEILDSIFEKKYQESSENFQKLIEHFALKDDKELKEMILSISNKLDLRYDKFEYLQNYDNLYYSVNAISSSVDAYLSLIKKDLSILRELVQEISEHLDSKDLEKIYLKTDSILNSKDYDEIKNSLLDCKLPPKNNNYDEEAVILKESIKGVLDDLKALCTYTDIEEMKKDLLATKSDTLEVVDIILKLQTIFKEVKEKEQLYDFNDISHLAIKLVLEHPDVREEIKNSFQEILIDEYQDTSDTQEMFISQISNNNVYMVGDIKQSIYRFRNANPYIFKEKYDSYNQDPTKGRKIDLNKNFRSRFEVLDNINLVFSYIMDDEIGGADYKKEHKMVFGNTTYINEGKTEQNYNMVLKTYEAGDDFKNIVKEAFIIGNDIKNKIDNHYQIFDKDSSVLRNAEYSDFLILMDRTTNFDLYKKIFLYLGIPLELYKDETMNEDTDIIVLNNLIKFTIKLDTGVYDKELEYLFTSVMRSFLCESPDEEIFDTIKNKTILTSPLANKVRKIKLNNKSSYEIINDLINEFDFYNKLITIGNESASSVKLNSILSNAKTTSSIGYDINSFSEYLDNVIKEKIDIKYTIHSGVSNSVKIMTIHKSKGLEFPICYFSGLYKPFNISDIKEKFTYSNKYGIITPYFDEGVAETIYKHLLKNDYLKEEISEKIRLFYVALTRAKEKMILVMPYEEIVNGKESDLVSNVVRSKYKSLLDIVSSTLVSLTKYVTVIDYNKSGITKDYSLLIKKDFKSGIEKSTEVLNVNELLVENETLIDKHYSKENNKLITSDVKKNMKFGKYVHEVLEYFDLKKKDYSYIKDEFIKNKIISFSNLPIFDNVNEANIFHEYEFIYTLNNTKYHGVIDLMLEYPSHIDIIDYKLSDVTDINYISQLNGYKEYISSITKKPVNVYLYSIINEKISSL